jgi:tryptophanyl-tRNA synthetase
MRAQYEELIHNPARIEQTLLAGAERARQMATPFLRELRSAVGLRSLVQASTAKAAKATKTALPTFKQYREQDGRFYFKLVDADGRLLLQSTGFDAPKEAGQAIALLQKDPQALQALTARLAPVDGVTEADVQAALQALADAVA